MKIFTLLFICLFIYGKTINAQAVFNSNGNGNWNDPSKWTLVSGTSAEKYPVAGDTASIANGDSIIVNVNSQCQMLSISAASTLYLNSSASILAISNSLSVSGISKITIDLGSLTVSGQATVNAASTVTINQGLMTVLGIMAVTSPTTSAGTTLLDVEGGAFSCAGGMSITATTIPANRFCEMRIGNSAVNIIGGIATITANAKINFTGNGALTLAGIISISPASFVTGNGTVIYAGIPGTDQILASLTYNKLIITGFGSGIKKITGNVMVTDTLTLLTDTLEVNTGGELTIGNAAAIVRTQGKLISPPVFAGIADIVYNNVAKDTTGNEMPVSASVVRNLTINDISGINLGSSITVNNNINLQNGTLLTDVYTLNITNPLGGAGTDPAVQRTNGYVTGKINRSIGTSVGTRLFPFGSASQPGAYRAFNINYATAPTTAGTLLVQHFDMPAANQSGFPLVDGSVTILYAAELYWQADATTLAGGIYTLSLTGQGIPGISNINNLRIIKRPSTGGAWILDGTAGTNTGSTSSPTVLRSGMSGFSQFTIGSDNMNLLPVSLLYFTGNISNGNVVLKWSTASEDNNSFFEIEYSTDGTNFTGIGKREGAGTTSQESDYTFTDQNVANGNNYYRLEQVNADGGSTYSNVIVFKITSSDNIKVYPTLATDNLMIYSTENLMFKLFNSVGQFIKNMNTGNNDISNLPRGIYYIVCKNGTFEFVKQ